MAAANSTAYYRYHATIVDTRVPTTCSTVARNSTFTTLLLEEASYYTNLRGTIDGDGDGDGDE